MIRVLHNIQFSSKSNYINETLADLFENERCVAYKTFSTGKNYCLHKSINKFVGMATNKITKSMEKEDIDQVFGSFPTLDMKAEYSPPKRRSY